MPEPANFFRSLAGVPVLYDRLRPSDYGVRGDPHNFHVPTNFQAALEEAFADLWEICPLGPARTILSAGTYSNRPPSHHATGRAMDIDAILWPERSFVTLNFPTDTVFYLAVESVLRRHFDYVLTYLYNNAHHDHFHVDQAGQVGFGKSRTKTNYVQAYCAHVLGLPTEVDGVWGSDTDEGLERAQSILEVPGDLRSLDRWKEFLRAAAAHAFGQALQVVDDDSDDAEVAALNRAIEFGMADHPLRKFALARVAGLHQRLGAAPAAAPADEAAPPRPSRRRSPKSRNPG